MKRMKKMNSRSKSVGMLLLLLTAAVLTVALALVSCKGSQDPADTSADTVVEDPVESGSGEISPDTDALGDTAAPSEDVTDGDSTPGEVQTLPSLEDVTEEVAQTQKSDDETHGQDVPDRPDTPDAPVTRPPVIDLPDEPTTEAPADDTQAPTQPETNEQDEAVTTQEPEADTKPSLELETLPPVDPHPGDSSLYKGVMISAVYGTGKKNIDAAAEAGFVQLYNASNKAVSLEGASLYYKSDGAKPYSQFIFPAGASIPANGYYLVRCNPVSGYDTTYAVLGVEYYDAQWNETLDNKEIRLLLAPTGWTVGKDDDILSFDDAISVFYSSDTAIVDHVYAVSNLSKSKVAVRTALKEYSGFHKVNLAERATAELQQVAPRTSDGRVNKVIAGRLDEVYFSAPAGVYDANFKLSLSADSGFTVYYTTDGSDPTNSATRKQYTAPITLRDSSAVTWGSTIKKWNELAGGGATPQTTTLPGGYVVKAYATDGTTSTPVYTNTYFINDELMDYGVSVISLSMPLTDMLGNEGFYNNFLLTELITGGRRRGLAVMEVFDKQGNRVGYSNVELAVSGNGSSGHTMKSLRIYYKSANNLTGGMDSDLDYDLFGGYAKDDDGYVITSFDRLLLRNSGNDCLHSYIRDAYMQRVTACTNVDTMATASTLVFINGEFWGVYNMRERYSPEYVESHYGVDKDNVTIIESDYAELVYNQNPNAYYVDSSGIVGGAAEFNALIDYIDSHNLSDPAAYAYVCERMDIESFIDLWAVRCFFNARDWPENNMKIWKNTNPDDPSGFDTKWHFTMLDMDMGLAYFPAWDANDSSEHMDYHGMFLGSGCTAGRIMRGLLANSEFKDKFIIRYYELITEVFTPEYLSGVFEAMVTERTPLMPLQQNRWGNSGASVNTWNSDVADIRSYIKNRQAYALSQMCSYFGVSAEDIENMSYRRVTISYNSDRVSVDINGYANVASGTIFRFEAGSYTFTVKANVKEGYVLKSIVFTDRNGQSQTVTGQNTATFTVTSTGTISVYAVREGGAAKVADGGFVAGATYLFYLADNGELYAWGGNNKGVLGLGGALQNVSTSTLVMKNVAKVATTQSSDYENGNTAWMTAILTKDGKLYTVGANANGQLGRNGTTEDNSLGQVSFSGTIVDVSVGHDHLLILDDKGQMWGVGNNSYGQLGVANLGGSVTTFQKVATGVAQISAGRRSTAYIDQNDDLWVLGDNRWDKMTPTQGDVISTPVCLLSDVVYISSGEHQLVAVTANGDLYYTGWRKLNSFVNDGSDGDGFQKLMGGVKKASIYYSNMVILAESGDAYVYGHDMGGGIGGSNVTGGTPKKIYADVIDVVAGYNFTAYVCEDGTIRILGTNSNGQAGNGTVGGNVNFAEVDI